VSHFSSLSLLASLHEVACWLHDDVVGMLKQAVHSAFMLSQSNKVNLHMILCHNHLRVLPAPLAFRSRLQTTKHTKSTGLAFYYDQVVFAESAAIQGDFPASVT